MKLVAKWVSAIKDFILRLLGRRSARARSEASTAVVMFQPPLHVPESEPEPIAEAKETVVSELVVAKIAPSAPVEKPDDAIPAKPKSRRKNVAAIDDDEPDGEPLGTHEYGEEKWKSLDHLLDTANRSISIWCADWDKHIRNHVLGEDRLAFKRLPKFLDAHCLSMESNKGRLRMDSVEMQYGLPSYACVVMNWEKLGKKQSRGLIIFVKQHDTLPPWVIPTGPGWAFEARIVYVFDEGKAPITKWVTIDSNGEIYLTRVLRQEKNKFRVHRGEHRGFRTVSHWRAVIDDMKTEGGSTLRGLVAAALSAWKHRMWQWLIIVKDARGRFTFSVPEQDIYRLFAERDREAGRSRRKALLHWVRYHDRTGSGTVKRHLRGVTSLRIRGFEVEVGIPGKHFMNANDVTCIHAGGTFATACKSLAAFLRSPNLKAVSSKEFAVIEAREEVAPEEDYIPVHDPRGSSHYYNGDGDIARAA